MWCRTSRCSRSRRIRIRPKPLIYKISGVWGNHEGSMVLWILILGAYSAAMAMTQPTGPEYGTRLASRALGVQALVAIAFLFFILLTSDPFERVLPAAVRRHRPQSAVAGSRPRVPSAAALSRLCRPFGRVLICGGSAARFAQRCDVGARGAPVRAHRLDRADARDRRRLVVGVLHARLGRLLVLGSGRERLADAVADRNRADPLDDGDRTDGRVQELDAAARDHRVLVQPDRDVPRPLRRAEFGA